MLMSDIKRVIEQVSRDKGIEPGVLVKTLEEALKSAARKKYGSNVDIDAHYDEETGEIEVFATDGFSSEMKLSMSDEAGAIARVPGGSDS